VTARRLRWPATAVGAVCLVAVSAALIPLAVKGRATEPRVVLAGNRPAAAAEAPMVGLVDASTPVSLAIALTPRAPIPHSAAHQVRPLTSAEFAATYGASEGAVAAVSQYLAAYGITTTVASPDGLLLDAAGTVGQVEAAFGAREGMVQLKSGRVARAALDEPSLPASLAPLVRAVVGLDTVAEFHPHLSRAPRALARVSGGSSGVCGQTAPPGATPYQPAQLAGVYDLSGLYAQGFRGQGQTVALFELTDYKDADVSAYVSCYGLGATKISRIKVDGGAIQDANALEADLDIDAVLGEEPALSTLLVYGAPNTPTGDLDNFKRIVSDNLASVVSVTFGDCEQHLGAATLRAESDILAQAALQGQTFLAATGDTGSDDCVQGFVSVDDPASQPQVVAVGGTTLNPGLAASASYIAEAAWNWAERPPAGQAPAPAGTGGGASFFWPQPPYQHAIDLSLGGNPYTQPSPPPCGSECREVPDVSADADPATGYYVSCTTVVSTPQGPQPCPSSGCPSGWCVGGGTSFATPLVAAVMSLVDQYRAAHAQGPLGDPHALLYNLGTGPGSPFHDVVAGYGVTDNDPTAGALHGAYPVTAGYDMATGLGSPNAAAVAGASPTQGYWMVAPDGGIFAFGPRAVFAGSMGGRPLNAPIVGMAATPDGRGYWLVASDGGIFAFGNAQFFGSMGGRALSKPIIAIAAAPDGLGYWLVASDGGIFAFGRSAQFFGSMGGRPLNKPIVAMTAAPDGQGYWLVASDGGIFAFGPSAKFFGSMGNRPLFRPIVGMASTPSGQGYWLVASDGGIFAFGPNAQFYGSTGGQALNSPVVGMASTADGHGYWMDASDGGIFAFGNARFFGSMGGRPLNQPVEGMAATG